MGFFKEKPMFYYALAVVAFLLTLAALFGPPIIRNAQENENRFILIKMRPPEWFRSRPSPYSGVYAQEAGEWWLGAFVSALIVLAVSVYLPATIIGAIIAVAVFALSALWKMVFFKQVEYVGHAMECLEASRVGYNLDEYIEREAYRMQIGYGGEKFGGGAAKALRTAMPVAKILSAILSRPIKRERKFNS